MASLILVPFSLLLWGLVGNYHGHWFGLVFAQFTLSISNAIAAPIALSYAISSYRDMSGELVTTAVIIRNTMSFAINYGYVASSALIHSNCQSHYGFAQLSYSFERVILIRNF